MHRANYLFGQSGVACVGNHLELVTSRVPPAVRRGLKRAASDRIIGLRRAMKEDDPDQFPAENRTVEL